MILAATILAVAAGDAAVVPLDAGTWLRPSLSVLPIAAAPCQPASTREMLEEWKADHPAKGRKKPKPPSEEELGARARGRDRICEEVRRGVEAGGARWTGLSAMHRFDANPLPEELDGRMREALEKGMPRLESTLPELAQPLREWLEGVAVDRAQHLESDFQKNSMVSEKAHEEDIVASQTRKVRDAAWILAQRVEGLRLHRAKGLWIVSGRRTLGLWRFRADPSRFRRAASWESAFETEIVDPSRAAAAAFGAGAFDARLLELEDFRFTAQMESSEKGWRPWARISIDTDTDLRPGRRFIYRERALQADGSTRTETVGYGFLEDGGASDRGTTWRLRHIGGRDPYDGLVAQEVPGNIWAVLGVERTVWESSNAPASSSGPGWHLDEPPEAWGIRGGWRGPAPGDLPGQSLYLDLSASWASLSGTFSDRDATGMVLRYLGGAWGLDVSGGWVARWNIRRLFFVGGAGVGIRRLGVGFSGTGGTEATSGGAGLDPEMFHANGLALWQPHVDLVAGLQFSATAYSGLGLQLRYEAWRGEPDWKASGGASDFRSISGSLQPSRLSLALQWVGG